MLQQRRIYELGVSNDSSTYHRSDRQLECKPSVAGQFDVEERLVRVGALLVQRPHPRVVRERNGRVSKRRDPHVWMRFKSERQHRDADEEHRHDRNHLQHVSNNEYHMRNNVLYKCRPNKYDLYWKTAVHFKHKIFLYLICIK